MAHAAGCCVFESRHSRAFALRAERRVAARKHPATRIEHVLAQHDVLARDVGLVRAAAVVATDDAAVGRRALRPVDKVAVERQLLRRVIARWQTFNERRDLPAHWIHGHNARAVVVPRRSQRLVRIGCEQAATVESILERDVDSRAMRLEPAPCRCWLGKRTSDLVSILIEYEDVGREGICRAEGPPYYGGVFIIALARGAGALFKDGDFGTPPPSYERF